MRRAKTSTPWPAVDIQRVPWSTNPDQRSTDGRRPPHRDRMLAEIDVEIPARIADLNLALDTETAAACEAAAVAIVSLDHRAGDLGGLSDLLTRTETIASSKVEHIYADQDDIARASIGVEAGEKARRTVAAAAAMRTLVDAATVDGITEESLLVAHRELLAGDLWEGENAGRFRTVQNWIGGSDFSPLDAVHIPPPAAHVEPLMVDLLAFTARDDMNAVGQAAVAHAQFEAIHPFTDGNGRVGRALIGAVLRRRRVQRATTVPIAAVMLADIDTYFERLQDYREGDVQALVAYVAASAQTAATEALSSADRLAALPAQWRERVRARRGSSADTLLTALPTMPVLDARIASRITGSTSIRTYEALDRLEGAGILHELTGKARNRVWVVTDIMDELTELEERIGRRAIPTKRWQVRGPKAPRRISGNSA